MCRFKFSSDLNSFPQGVSGGIAATPPAWAEARGIQEDARPVWGRCRSIASTASFLYRLLLGYPNGKELPL